MSPTPSGLRVLLADDCQDTRRALALLLEMCGHQVLTAADGGEAVRQAEDFRPDVALLDIGIPVLSGYEVAALLRWRGLAGRVIALTGRSGPGDPYTAAEAGFDDYLVKPCDPGRLVNLLREAAASEPVSD